MIKHRLAFAGFRHPHILALWARAKAHPQCQIVAAWENNPAMRAQLRANKEVSLTHESFEQMLDDSDCLIVAVGDVYADRGALVIAALKAGKHVIADKPICTTLAEFDQISRLAREENLTVGCQLDLVESGVIRRLQQVIQQQIIGSICTITIAAQHPLRLDSRRAGTLSRGRHGGTVNDIGVHVFDLVPWLTGSRWKGLLAAREWNAKAGGVAHFKDCAQFLAVTESGASCFADLSYLAPDTLGYELPQYWRVTVHGTKGMAEACYTLPYLTMVTDTDTAPQQLPALTAPSTGYLQDFLDEIAGSPSPYGLTTARVLYATRQALEAQAKAGKEVA